MKLSDNKYLLYRKRWINPNIQLLLSVIRLLSLLAAVILILAVVYEYGFVISEADSRMISQVYHGVWLMFAILLLSHLLFRFDATRQEMNTISWIFFTVYMLTLIPAIFHQPEEGPLLQFWLLMKNPTYRLILSMICSLVSLAQAVNRLLSRRANPSLIGALSFLFIILAGTGLLLLPRCTFNGISWVDALFYSTSAVCVTGLSPMEITETFTHAGLGVLMLLIQIGGLGVMTFTSFFALFFMGNTSIYNRLMVRDIVSSNSLNSLLSVLLYILGFTLVIEAFGALAIWTDIHGTLGLNLIEEIRFSIFNSISAFCNAGFTTMPGGLSNPLIYHNHTPFFLYLSVLIILGGIGFPILVNFKDILALYLKRIWTYIRFHHDRERKVYHMYNINTRIVLIMTLVLLIVPTICFASLEWNGALAGLSVKDKVIQAFFLAVCPRTAGFSPIDPMTWTSSTLLIYCLLMWIGGGSQSTAGGIKVNAFAVVLFNLWAILRGKDRVEVFRRELSPSSIQRSNATVLLSIGVLFVAVFLLNMLEPELSLKAVVVECVSALGTVGFSLNATPLLHDAGKMVIIPLMYFGRLGLITILLGVVKQQRAVNYHYPSGEIIIN